MNDQYHPDWPQPVIAAVRAVRCLVLDLGIGDAVFSVSLRDEIPSPLTILVTRWDEDLRAEPKHQRACLHVHHDCACRRRFAEDRAEAQRSLVSLAAGSRLVLPGRESEWGYGGVEVTVRHRGVRDIVLSPRVFLREIEDFQRTESRLLAPWA